MAKQSIHKFYICQMIINKIQFPSFNCTNFGKQNNCYNSPKLNAPLNSDVFIKSAEKTTSPIFFTGIRKAEPDYSNTEKFAEYLEEKIAKQLKDPTEKDVKRLINNISQRAEIDKKQALEIVSRLTQFSNYSQLENLEDALMNSNISYHDRWLTGYDNHFGINDVIAYLSKKSQFHFSDANELGALFIDKPTLKYIKENMGCCRITTGKIRKGRTIPIIIDGWCAEFNGKNLSHGLFGGPLNLEDAAVEIGKEVKNGNTLDEILNGEIIRKTKEVLGENVQYEIIKNKEAKPTIKSITEQMQSLRPDKEMIKNMLNAIVESRIDEGEIYKKDEKRALALLAQYFDTMINCFSSSSMTEILKAKYKQIEKFVKSKGKTMDDVIYIVPNKTKSFGLVTYQYVNVNNVDYSQIERKDIDDFMYNNADKVNDKIFVILDDIVGSGSSVLHQQFDYRSFLNNSSITGNKDMIVSPISALKQGINRIKEQTSEYRKHLKGNKGRDIIWPHVTVDYKKLQNKIGDENFAMLAKLLGHPGYNEGFACTAMPYTIPDNDTAAAGFLLDTLLNDSSGNNSNSFGFNFCDYMPIKDELDEIFEAYA